MQEAAVLRRAKACRSCAKAKARCELGPSGPCKRCSRLKKECATQEPMAHRTPGPSMSQHPAVLEQKLDRMMSMLATAQPSMRAPSPLASAGKAAYTPDFQEATVSIDSYRQRMTPIFPFVQIPSGISPEGLFQNHTLLFLTVSMVSCENALRQREAAQAVKEYIAEHVIMQAENSLDILQGLLVFIAWRHSYLEYNIHINTLVHLAQAQVTCLGLNQPLSLQRPINIMRELGAAACPTSRTSDERRAYLGYYFITSLLSACFGSIDSARWTKYTDECCGVVEDAVEYSHDVYLVRLARLSRLANTISHNLSPGTLSLGSTSAPLGLAVRWLQAEFEKLKSSISPALQLPQSGILSLHLHTTEILLYRVTLTHDPSTLPSVDSLDQLDMLYSCLKSTESFFRCLYSLPAELFAVLPYSVWVQIGHAVVILSRLSLHQSDHGDWDREYVRKTIDFYKTCDELVRKLEEACRLREQEQEQDRDSLKTHGIVNLLSRRVGQLKESHHQKGQALEASDFSAGLPLDQQPMLGMPWYDMFPFGPNGDLFDLTL